MSQIDRSVPLSDQNDAVDVLCCAALIAEEILPRDATVEQAYGYYSLRLDGYCSTCPAREHCAVCTINA